jgi:hypothetical protein
MLHKDKYKEQKFELIAKPSTAGKRLSEIASLIHVAVWRQFVKERDNFVKNSLDSYIKRSVTAAANKYGG